MSTTFGTPSKLLGSPINILALRNDARSELQTILGGLHGQICLVVDPRLIPALKLIIVEGSKYMKELNVDKILELSTSTVHVECDTVLYLTRPSLALTELIAAQVKAFARRGIRRRIHVAFVPRRTFVCEQLLKEEGVWDDITVLEYGLDMIPLDDDVLTLGLDNCFREACVQGDTSSLLTVARALHKLQSVFGLVPSIRSKGPLAKTVLDMLLRMGREEDGVAEGSRSAASVTQASDKDRRELVNMTVAVGSKGSASAGTVVKPEIDYMVILDRSVDLVTPLVTPLTTEALFHELLQNGGLDFGMAQIDMAILAPEEEHEVEGKHGPKFTPGTLGTMHCNSNDKVYGEIRDLNVQAAGPHLTSKAKELQSFREQIKASKNMAVADIHLFVKAIPTLQQDSRSLRILVDLLSTVQTVTNSEEFVNRWNMERGLLDEEGFKEAVDSASALIAKKAPLTSVLRLLCLDSVLEGGLKGKVVEGIRREMLASYGFEALWSLVNLEKAGLLTSREGGRLGGLLGGSGSGWGTLRKSLNLTVPNVDVDAPSDIHYVTSGYAPLSVRLIQAAVAGIHPPGSSGAPAGERSGWESIADALRLLPGATVQVQQMRKGEQGGAGAHTQGDGDGGRKVCLAVFIGGVTHMEVSALRFLSEKYPVDFVVLTTSMLHGGQLLESLMHPLPGVALPGIAQPVAVGARDKSAKGDKSKEKGGAQVGKVAAPTSKASEGKGTGTGTGSKAPASSSSFFGFGGGKGAAK